MPDGVIVHSDRDSQYCSHAFQVLLKHHGLRCSMSERGDCYDNVYAESFFHSLKVELTLDSRYSNTDELCKELFEYIETYYDPTRRHSALSYLDPRVFEHRHAAKLGVGRHRDRSNAAEGRRSSLSTHSGLSRCSARRSAVGSGTGH